MWAHARYWRWERTPLTLERWRRYYPRFGRVYALTLWLGFDGCGT